MKDAQKPDHVSLTNMINWLQEGRYVIPDFQREFEWEPWDILELMRSIFLDYHIGSLLLWRGKPENFDALACESIYGFDGNGDPTHIVLDGQQRLTAMYYAFMAPDIRAPSRRNRYLYFICVDRFMEEAYDDAFKYDWTRRGVNLLADRARQFREHMFPLSVVGAGGWELPNWVQDYERYWRDAAEAGDEAAAQVAQRHAENAGAFGEHLRDITGQYQISYIELDRDLEIDKVCDIFTKINSRGRRLDVFDLINALIKPKGVQLKQLWRDAAPRLDFVETERMDVYILQVMSILCQAYCSPKYLYYLLPGQERKVRQPDGSLRADVLVRDAADFRERWESSVTALERAIGLLRHPQEFGAISSQYLPYVAILPVFAAIQAKARTLPADQRLGAQRKIRSWYWASVFTNRYSGSVESTSARDYQDVHAWFTDDAAEPGLIGEFQRGFRDLDLRREIRRGTSIYNGIFNLLMLRDARDWITGNVPQHDGLDDHHIVPKSWGNEHALGTRIDTILNRTPLTQKTNRDVIRGRLPNTYLRELVARNDESHIRGILESHCISPQAFDILMRDPFAPDDFEAFIAERHRTFVAAIEDLLVKERLDLAPQIREIDAEIEAIELKLRCTIAECLDGDVRKLPSHVLQRIGERLQATARRNPALDSAHYETLDGRLEYADLRELQDTITNRALWSLFQGRFRNKELLGTRFQQFADLRNSIAHSRTVDEITRKDGEAAILWFRQILGKAGA